MQVRILGQPQRWERELNTSSARVPWFFWKDGQPYYHRCAFVDLAFNFDAAAVQFGAALDQQQAQSGAGPRANVASAIERLE